MSEELDPDRPIREERDGAVYYRASAIGSCVRALVAAAKPKAYPPRPHPEWFMDVLNEGKRMETVIDNAWQEQTDVPTINHQARVTLYIGEINGKDVYVEGSIDGQRADRNTLREYKKFRDSTWPTFVRNGIEVHVNYPWQTSVYMHGGEFDDVEFVGGHYWCTKDDDGNITEEGISEVHGHTLTGPPIPLKAIRLKVAMVERLINDGYDPKEVECSVKFPCAWWYLHDIKDDDKPERVEVDLSTEWLDAITQLGRARETKAQAEREEKAAKAALDALLGEHTSVKAGEWWIDKTTVARAGYEVKPTTFATYKTQIAADTAVDKPKRKKKGQQ